MKTLIIYATKHGGATKIIAQAIAECMGNAILHDINSNNNISVNDYECVILGSSLTAGQIDKGLKRFAAENVEELQNKKLGIFLSGLQASGEEGYLKQNFPAELLDKAVAKAFMGGIFDPEKCGFLARTAIKVIAKLDSYTSTIDEEKIAVFAQTLLKE